jgi:hypothetical protein
LLRQRLARRIGAFILVELLGSTFIQFAEFPGVADETTATDPQVLV